jgi:hypothetical protein
MNEIQVSSHDQFIDRHVKEMHGEEYINDEAVTLEYLLNIGE